MRALSISPEETTFARRGFRTAPPSIQSRLEGIGQTFLIGYHLALEHDVSDTLAIRLNGVERELQGFAYEGAAMALALLDHLLPGRNKRAQRFLQGAGVAHSYMVHVGMGWALARLRRRVERPLAYFDPVYRWLAVDGYGFHEGYFYWPRYVREQTVPKKLSGYALKAFDQGLGRCLWFVEGADVERIPSTIASFSPSRHSDLWSGIGLASAYAGGVEVRALELLLEASGAFRPSLAQGAAFAAKARQRADNATPHTDRACELFCNLSADDAATITDHALHQLPQDDDKVPAYEIWRQRIQAHFSLKTAVSPPA
ncbi:MAG: DUF1702 family protein [Rhodothermales bacterium]